MTVEMLSSIFYEKFSKTDFRMFFAPGRINLIGEHTDYNGGHVFPCAITFGTYALTREREDQICRFYSVNFPEIGVIEFSLDELKYDEKHNWANYPKGMIRYFLEAGYPINQGMDILYYGNIPNGAGLSSSASIELVTGVLLENMFGLTIDRVDIVKIGQKVENLFIGVNSGIMDQFAIGMGKQNHGILLDCNNLQYEYAPINLVNHRIIIMNTNKRRELADSKYNERRAECEEALKVIQNYTSAESLGNLSVAEFTSLQENLPNEIIKKRAKHAVYENERTIKALQALKQHDLAGFGKLMNESHISLRDDYEVTGIELDTIVEAAWQQEGVIGARMTGAGFGGCAIAIVETDKIPAFVSKVGETYEQKIGYAASFYDVTIGDGARELPVESEIA
ncbi:galactokinase [Caldibacillus lycopersici]|uniref:Galactokinase n=1 Tax=Perspicuibacillus lycopersici TaxID=1325689 RepID=A0AAE3IY87_9BACI|nr:galactokinase [Perspicuibacillus lycopersici]MCU9615134.1 galactokinase [Perspicuibacillus lycopersici]